MPFLPLVRCQNVDQAIELAQHYEHGYRHTSMIHSQNVHNTKMARVMDTTLFIKNGPCGGFSLGGEGYLSFSIAGPTGEGVTTPLTFTRERRCSLIDDLWILGGPSAEVVHDANCFGDRPRELHSQTFHLRVAEIVNGSAVDGRRPNARWRTCSGRRPLRSRTRGSCDADQ